MSTCQIVRRERFRPSSLTACLTAALGIAIANASAGEPARSGASNKIPSAFTWLPQIQNTGANSHGEKRGGQARLATPHSVTSCADGFTPGTLRYEVANATSGDTIDLSALPCSVITLDPAQVPTPIQILQDTLYLKGPAAGANYLTISGGNQSAVLQHLGGGTLYVTDLTIADGQNIDNVVGPDGGCISSLGSVSLARSKVTHCVAGSNAQHPRGGGIFTSGNLSLSASTIADCRAIGINHYARGGGAFVIGSFSALYSTIDENASSSKYSDHTSQAGGIAAFGVATVQGSTISGNSSDINGGILAFAGGVIINSTISDNKASRGYSGLLSYGPLEVTNATIAFNTAGSDFSVSGLYSLGNLTLKSSIIADNSNAIGPSDLGGNSGIVLTGAYNLITSSTLPPLVDTITACPQLQPLADTGGHIKTHALSHTSPAIDMGKNVAGLVVDQRSFSRVWGADADIGSVEWHPTDVDERIMANGFDGACD